MSLQKFTIEPGAKIHRWTVVTVNPDDLQNPTLRGSTALCRCSCGTEKVLSCVDLRYGRIKSCGCAVGRNPNLSQFQRQARAVRKKRSIARKKREYFGTTLNPKKDK